MTFKPTIFASLSLLQAEKYSPLLISVPNKFEHLTKLSFLETNSSLFIGNFFHVVIPIVICNSYLSFQRPTKCNVL